MEIRQAVVREAAFLSALAVESKSHWGYPLDVIESWRQQLQISSADIASMPIFVGVMDDKIVGFYSLMPSRSMWVLDSLWVAPPFMRRGVGRALLTHALDKSFRGGASSVTVDADPNAEAFYLSCGAVRCSEIPAPISDQPNRVRPQLVFDRFPATPK